MSGRRAFGMRDWEELAQAAIGRRELDDLRRGREYIEAALTGVRVHVEGGYGRRSASRPATGAQGEGHDRLPPSPFHNITDELFGAYSCTICPSYLHKTSDHRARYGEGRR